VRCCAPKATIYKQIRETGDLPDDLAEKLNAEDREVQEELQTSRKRRRSV